MHLTNDLNDCYLGSGVVLRNAIKRHGRKSFVREIVRFFDNAIEAHRHEEELIVQHKTLKPNGYNVSPTGGIDASGGRHGEDFKKRMSGPNHPFYGQHHTAEANEKNRQAHLGKPSSFRGKTHSEESKEKNRQAHSGRSPANKGQSMSEEQKKKISEACRGRKDSEETRKKKSLAKKGKAPNNAGQVSSRKNLSFEEFFGEEKARKMKQKLSSSVGKLWENKEYRKRMSESHRKFFN